MNLPITNINKWIRYDGEKNSYYILYGNNNERKEEFMDTDETAYMKHLNEYHHGFFHASPFYEFEGIAIIIKK